MKGKFVPEVPSAVSAIRSVSLWTLFWMFLKIGGTAFGGFMALISVVQNYVVERKRLLSHEEMLDGISLATILPGPVAVNVVAYVGYKLRGGMGGLVSALGVILPSFILILALSYAYFRWGQIPAVTKLFMGFIPAVTAIIAAAAWGMARKTIKGFPEAAIAVSGLALLLWVGGFFITLAIIAGAGLVGWLIFRNASTENQPGTVPTAKRVPKAKTEKKRKSKSSRLMSVGAPLLGVPLLSMDFALAAKLFVSFAGMSVLLFGGGFVFIPLIQESVVNNFGWVTHEEFIDGIALGQVTPGPILISATFIGYKVAGLIGATAATIGIFTPPALLMIGSAHFLDRIKRSETINAILRGIRSVVIGMITAAAFVVAGTAPQHWFSMAIFAIALFALLRLRLEVVWIIPAAGISGLLLY